DALLAKGSKPPARAEVGGWTVLADSQAKIDLFKQGGTGPVLANDQEFQSVMKRLPADTLARVYLAGAPVQGLADTALQQNGAKAGATQGFGSFSGLSLSATAEDNGLRLDGAVDATLSRAPDSYKAELPSDLPSGAYLFVSFNQLDRQLRQVLSAVEDAQPNLKASIGQVEAVLGLSLEQDVFPLVSGEGAIAVYPSTGSLPTIEAVLRVPDEAKARQVIDQIGAIADRKRVV